MSFIVLNSYRVSLLNESIILHECDPPADSYLIFLWNNYSTVTLGISICPLLFAPQQNTSSTYLLSPFREEWVFLIAQVCLSPTAMSTTLNLRKEGISICPDSFYPPQQTRRYELFLPLNTPFLSSPSFANINWLASKAHECDMPTLILTAFRSHCILPYGYSVCATLFSPQQEILPVILLAHD